MSNDVWEQIARLLKSEPPLSNGEISRRLRVSPRTVARVREDLGVPRYWIGMVPAWDQERFDRTTQQLPGGHRLWKGTVSKDGTPVTSSETAYQIAFRLHHDRIAVGRLNRSCRQKRCVEGAHQVDALMRDEALGRIEKLTELPAGASYQGMDLVAIRRALRGPKPYPELDPREQKFAARFADAEMSHKDLARRLGCCERSATKWRGAAS